MGEEALAVCVFITEGHSTYMLVAPGSGLAVGITDTFWYVGLPNVRTPFGTLGVFLVASALL